MKTLQEKHAHESDVLQAMRLLELSGVFKMIDKKNVAQLRAVAYASAALIAADKAGA